MNETVKDVFDKYRSGISVNIILIAIGNAPKLKTGKIVLEALDRDHHTFQYLYEQLSKATNLQDIHIYINNSFEPSPNQVIVDLARMFGKIISAETEKPKYQLNIHYSIGRAYLFYFLLLPSLSSLRLTRNQASQQPMISKKEKFKFLQFIE